MYYTFRQNNSFGTWKGPAKFVIVEAADVNQASSRAEEVGVYFDGCDSGMDCPCCGDRWSTPYEDGTETPMIYGEPIADYRAWNDDEDVLIYRLDNTQEIIRLKPRE